MSIVDAWTDHAEQQTAALRERQRQQRMAAIVNNPALTEIPRSELRHMHAGVLERDNDTGDWFVVFGGEPGQLGSDVSAYFIDADGDPVLLQRARPSARHRPAAKEPGEGCASTDREREHGCDCVCLHAGAAGVTARGRHRCVLAVLRAGLGEPSVPGCFHDPNSR